MNLADAYIVILDWMILQAKNKKYLLDLEDMKNGLKNKKTVDQKDSPKHKSILLGYHNLFPFSDDIMIIMASEILKENDNVQLTKNIT